MIHASASDSHALDSRSTSLDSVATSSLSSHFCLNQCSGRGECEGGYCRCERGSYGADCSANAAGGPLALARSSAGDVATVELSASARSAAAAVRSHAAAASPAGEAQAKGSGAGGGAPTPRVYVYELPGEFNTFLLTRRLNADSCVLRNYVHKQDLGRRRHASGGGAELDEILGSDSVGVRWTETLYGAEVASSE